MATIRDLFPFGDIDDTVVATAQERFPIIQAEELGAAFALGKAMVETLDTMASTLGRFDISPARWRLLIALVVQSDLEGATIGQLAGHLGVREPTVTATVDRMESEGLVARRRDPDDGRVVRVSPTADGHSLVKRLLPEIATRLSRFVEAMGGPDAVRDTAKTIDEARTRLEED